MNYQGLPRSLQLLARTFLFRRREAADFAGVAVSVLKKEIVTKGLHNDKLKKEEVLTETLASPQDDKLNARINYQGLPRSLQLLARTK